MVWQRTQRGANTWRQGYQYDGLNRLTQASESQMNNEGASAWQRDYAFNRWGNMWVSGNSSGGPVVYSFTPQAESNFDALNRLHIQLADYDAAGNQKAIGGYSFTFDGENRMASSTLLGNTATYSYDGEGRRVKKGSTVFVYDAFGKLAAEYGGTTSETGTKYLTQDHLGSTRLVTNSIGAEVTCYDYEPFGQQLMTGLNGRPACFGSDPGADPQKVRFTGKERDAETGLDYFSARYLSAAQGRFTSPDVPFADQWEKNPQSWNLYSYARNNPLRFIDPAGRCSQAPGGGYTDEGSGLFPGPCSGGTIGDSNNNTNSVTVTAKKGNAVGAFLLNALFALDNTANNYFAWMFKERPKLLENTPPTKEFVGQAAAATVFVGTMMVGPSGGAQAPLRLIRSEATLSKTILDGLRKKSTQEIIDSLKPGLEEGLKVKPDGRVMDGNHRIKVLMERGVDVNSLPREVLK